MTDRLIMRDEARRLLALEATQGIGALLCVMEKALIADQDHEDYEMTVKQISRLNNAVLYALEDDVFTNEKLELMIK